MVVERTVEVEVEEKVEVEVEDRVFSLLAKDDDEIPDSKPYK